MYIVELKTAEAACIPVIVVIDVENYKQRELVDKYRYEVHQ